MKLFTVHPGQMSQCFVKCYRLHILVNAEFLYKKIDRRWKLKRHRHSKKTTNYYVSIFKTLKQEIDFSLQS